MSKLLDFYKSALELSDCVVDDNGNILGGVFSGQKKQAYIDGRMFLLPTYENLRRTDQDALIWMHPLRENVIKRGESKVMHSLRSWAVRRCVAAISACMTEMLGLALDGDKHLKLTPDQTSYIKELRGVDVNALSNLTDLLVSSAKKTAEHPVITINVRRPGARIGTESKRVRRVAVINFPLYLRICELFRQDNQDKSKLPKGQKIVKDKRVINGVEIRKTDVFLFKTLFELILPTISTDSLWVKETDADVGPSYLAFLAVLKDFVLSINTVALLFQEHFDGVGDIIYNPDWIKDMDDIQSIIKEVDSIPMLFGNDGGVSDTDSSPSMLADVKIESSIPPIAEPISSIKDTSVKEQTNMKIDNSVAPWDDAPSKQQHVEQPNIIHTPRPPIARPIPSHGVLNANQPNGFNPGQFSGPAIAPKEPIFKGNRLPSLDEITRKEQEEKIKAMLQQRERLAQNNQQVQSHQAAPVIAPIPVAQPQQTQFVHNGVVYQAVGVAPQQQLMPAQPMLQPGPLTLNHLVPPMGMGMNNQYQPNPVFNRNAPVFGQTVAIGAPQQQFQQNGFGLSGMGGMPGRLI